MTDNEDCPTRQGMVGVLRPSRGAAADRVRLILDAFSPIVVATRDMASLCPDMVWTSVVVNASTNQLGAFTGQLGRIPGVRVKSFLV